MNDVSAWISSLETVSISAMLHSFFERPEYRVRPITPWTYMIALFQGLLGRAPDAIERESWVRHVRESYKIMLSEFLSSAEFRQPGADCNDPYAVSLWVIRLLQQALGRIPGMLEQRQWTDNIMAQCIVQEVAGAFFTADEYLSVPRTLMQHVVILYRSLLARDPSTEEVTYWVDRLTRQLQAIEPSFVSSPELQARVHTLFQ